MKTRALFAIPIALLLSNGAQAQDFYYAISYGWGPWFGWGYSPGYPCCGPGYGWGYPWAPVSTVSYAVGTLLITMMDPSRPDNGVDTAPVLWVAAINGLLEDSTSGIVTRITNLIGQAFDQSPYLNPNANLPN